MVDLCIVPLHTIFNKALNIWNPAIMYFIHDVNKHHVSKIHLSNLKCERGYTFRKSVCSKSKENKIYYYNGFWTIYLLWMDCSLLIPPKWIAFSFFGFGDVTSFSQVLRKWAEWVNNILKISQYEL